MLFPISLSRILLSLQSQVSKLPQPNVNLLSSIAQAIESSPFPLPIDRGHHVQNRPATEFQESWGNLCFPGRRSTYLAPSMLVNQHVANLDGVVPHLEAQLTH